MRVWLPYAEWAGDMPSGVDVDVYDADGALPSTIEDVEMYVIPYMVASPEPLEAIRSMPSLRVVQTLTAGVDNFLPYVREGVTLCNARGVHDASTAELAVALLLASLRGLPHFVRAQDRGEWAASQQRPALADRTVLIVGYGSVGAAVEARLAGFECTVLRVARRARDGVADLSALAALLARADVVVLTVPMTDETVGLVDASFLAAMRDGALLVNVARGPVVVTDALLAELQAGRLRAALDVTDPEPLPAGHPMWSAPGLLLSPHVGGNTSAFLPRARLLVAEQVRRCSTGAALLNVITGTY
jgi:phosphoglycerate dehydrogenase-like enzyme